MKIPFNKPFLTGKETHYIYEAVNSGKISGDGVFTKKASELLEKMFGFKKVLLTTSCTDALEMASILIDIKEGDEVIAPSFTFVSTVNPFVLRGAKIVFADSANENPNIDVKQIESLITKRTKAIVPIHYAGIACDMDPVMALAKKHGLYVVEDAAQAIDSYYKGRPLGTIGELSAFSFHETKNIISGEGGMLVINDGRFINRAEIIREKGTNRSAFFRGEVDKYGWVDIGSSYLPSEVIAAFLYAQIENLEKIQQRRKNIWQQYENNFRDLAKDRRVTLPFIPDYATNNAHMFYLVCRDLDERTRLIQALKEAGIYAVFHYLSLHKSPFYSEKHDGRSLPNTEKYSNCLVRLPLFYELKDEDVEFISEQVLKFYRS
jgi:dTDP-4-amino-4,6-dideoxygalactose transaminase